jgi:hypothetical protein
MFELKLLIFRYPSMTGFHDLHNLITKQCLVSTTFACATSCVFLDPNAIIELAIYITVICKVTLSLSLLSPPIPSFSGIRKVRKFYLNLSIKCTRFQINYSSCTGRSSENICSSSGGAQEKGKTG